MTHPVLEQASDEARQDERDIMRGRAWREALPGANAQRTKEWIDEMLQWVADHFDEDQHAGLIIQAHEAGLISSKELDDWCDCDGTDGCICPGDDPRCYRCRGQSMPCGHKLCDYRHEIYAGPEEP